MISWSHLLWGALGILVVAYLYFRVFKPFNHLRESLRRLAEHDYRPVLMESRWGVFHETSHHVRRISELLQQLDRQIADEGFSLRAILSSMVEGVLILDRRQNIRLVNDALHRMVAFKQSPVNRTIMEVFRSHHLQHAVEQTLATGEPAEIGISLSPTQHLEIHIGGLNPRPGGRPLGAVVVFHDVTTVKNLEAVRREFVANVSHEFRTPLAIINGYLETLLDGALDDREMAEKFLRVMHKNGTRLTLLIEDLLTISRMEHRAPRLDYSTSNLRDSMNHVLERLESAIRERHAQVIMDWADEACEIEADADRLEQVFSNLLENALRYGPAQNTQVKITARRFDDEIEIVFSDNGPGIPLEDQPHIFERFYRVHKDRSRVAGGTGLGLSIVKHIVHAHGGKVSVSSTPGAGAAFQVRVPVRRVAVSPSDEGGDSF